MGKKPHKRQERRMERELAGQYGKIRIRALAGALEHRGVGKALRGRKRSASYTRNKVKSDD
jgi:hypothetical protein